jgi:eukaryotic-like serine/threonine-protein kinase
MKKNYTISIPADRFWKRYVPIALVAVVIATGAGMFFVDTFIMPNIVGINRDMVTVPSIKGMEWEKGRQRLYEDGLLNEIRSREYDDKLPEGSILDQFPHAGTKVKKGRRIAVTLSKGKEIAVIPDVKDLTERQARIELKKRGFSIGKIKKTYSETRELDKVIDAFPQSGTTISRAMEVELIISKGPKPTHAEAPNIVGESLAEARKKIEDVGLIVGSMQYKDNPSLLPGTIVSQSVPPGTRVPLESSIDLVISVIR